MKTYFVHLTQLAITTHTDGTEETFTFRTKRQSDKKILEILKDGYKFDKFGWAAHQEAFYTSNPDYAPTPDHSF